MNQQIILFISLLLFVMIASVSSAQNSNEQLQLDAGVSYGNEIENLGIKGGAVYELNKKFRAAVDAIYFFSGEDANGLEFSWLEFNTNGHYLVSNQEKMNFYLLSGLNFTTLFSDNDDIDLPSGDSTNKIYVGVNIGAGVEYSLGSIKGVLEGKYALSSAHQLVVSAGLRIPL